MVAAAGAVLLLAGCTSGPSSGPDPRPGGGKDAAGNPYWADPDGNAARQVAAYTRDGDARSAALIRKIARQPVGQGIGSDTPEAQVRGFTEAARKAGREALLVYQPDGTSARLPGTVTVIPPAGQALARRPLQPQCHRSLVGVRDMGDRTGPDQLRRGDRRPPRRRETARTAAPDALRPRRQHRL